MPNSTKAEMKKALQLITKSERIFLTTHEGTDGDDLGSLLALRQALVKLGKNPIVAVSRGVPEYLKFLPGSQFVPGELDKAEFDLAIIFGCNTIARTGFAALNKFAGSVINIDHHPDNKKFGTINIVEPSTSSVAELMFYFFQTCEIKIDHIMATCLLTGIFTDTGGFKHPNTTAHTLSAVAELMKKGGRVDRVSKLLEGPSNPARYRIWSRALENTRLNRAQGLAYSVITAEDFAETQSNDDDLAGTIFVTMLNSIPEAKYAMLLRQDGEIVRGNLRSTMEKGVDVRKIASLFGGGGHKLASGFKVRGKLIKEGNGWKITPNQTL